MIEKTIDKNDFKLFFDDLKKEFAIYAPTRKGSITTYNFGAFDYINDIKWLNLDRLPISPPRRLFMPDGETLFEFEKKEDEVTLKENRKEMQKKQVLLGARSCDVASLSKLEKVFSETDDDPYYREKRANTLIIGLTCNHVTDHACFCSSTGSGPDCDSGYDLLMTDIDSRYFFRSGSIEGARILEKKYFKDTSLEDRRARENKIAVVQKELESQNKVNLVDIKDTMKQSFDCSVWDRAGERCVSCGSCTMVCPTCHCFSIFDKTNLGNTKGKRVRIMDSCHYEKFSTMAGGFNLRKNSTVRIKHRLYDKFFYSFLTYGEGFCVGCGRCIRHCQSEIDIRDVLGELNHE